MINLHHNVGGSLISLSRKLLNCSMIFSGDEVRKAVQRRLEFRGETGIPLGPFCTDLNPYYLQKLLQRRFTYDADLFIVRGRQKQYKKEHGEDPS